jgi:phosphoribosylformylglycinamidine synthase
MAKKAKSAHPAGGKPALLHFYRTPALSDASIAGLLKKAKAIKPLASIKSVKTEFCYTVELSAPLDTDEEATLVWLLSETFEPKQTAQSSFLAAGTVEIGPRLSYESPWSVNAVSVCKGCGLDKVVRIERSRRYLVAPALSGATREAFVTLVHDRMTETEYPEPLTSFGDNLEPQPTKTIPLMVRAAAAAAAAVPAIAVARARRSGGWVRILADGGTRGGAIGVRGRARHSPPGSRARPRVSEARALAL